MIWSAVLVQTKGPQRSFPPSMKVSMVAMKSGTDVNISRRMAWRVMIPKRISTMFSQDPEVGVKCRVTRPGVSGGCVLWEDWGDVSCCVEVVSGRVG